VSYYEPRCKVCTSPHRKEYERIYFEREGKITYSELEKLALKFGEKISRKAFERHFKRHYSSSVQEYLEKEELVDEAVEATKREAIDLVKEIRNNLQGLKTLLDKTIADMKGTRLSPTMLRVVTEIYREHRQSLMDCEKLTSKLTERTLLSEAELLKLLYYFGKDLCPNCFEKFKRNLEEYLRKKQNA